MNAWLSCIHNRRRKCNIISFKLVFWRPCFSNQYRNSKIFSSMKHGYTFSGFRFSCSSKAISKGCSTNESEFIQDNLSVEERKTEAERLSTEVKNKTFFIEFRKIWLNHLFVYKKISWFPTKFFFWPNKSLWSTRLEEEVFITLFSSSQNFFNRENISPNWT